MSRAVAQPSNRRRRLVALVALVSSVLLLVGAGCSSQSNNAASLAGDVALKVDDWTLSKNDFIDELQQVSKNQKYIDARTLTNAGKPFTIFKPGTNDPEPLVAAEFLNERISFRLAQDELKKRNISVTDADREQAIGLLGASLQRAQQGAPPSAAGSTSTSVPPAAPTTTAGVTVPGSTPAVDARAQVGQAVLDGFTGSYKQVLLDGVSSLVALQKALGGGGDPESKIRQLHEASKEEACVSHILVKASENAGKADPQTGQAIVASEAEYQSALVRATELRATIVGGADFATVAKESSADTSKDKGGDLGCRPRSAYVQAFDDAVWSLAPNTVSEPVKTPFGYHLILLREKRTSSFEEARPALEAAIEKQQSDALQEWLTEATRAARVEVNAAYGRWDPYRGSVSPTGEGPNLTLSPLESGPDGSAGQPGTTR